MRKSYNIDFGFDKRKLREAIPIDYEISSYFTSEFVKNWKLIETVNGSNTQRHSEFLRILNNNYDTRPVVICIRKCMRSRKNQFCKEDDRFTWIAISLIS